MSDDNLDTGHRPPGYISRTWAHAPRRPRTCRTFRAHGRPESEVKRLRRLRASRIRRVRTSFWAAKRELLIDLSRVNTFTVPPVIQWNPNGEKP